MLGLSSLRQESYNKYSYMHRNALLLFYSCRGWWVYRNRPFYLYGELAQSVKVFLVKTDNLSQKPHGEGESQLLQWFCGVLWKQINIIKQVKPRIAFSLPCHPCFSECYPAQHSETLESTLLYTFSNANTIIEPSGNKHPTSTSIWQVTSRHTLFHFCA